MIERNQLALASRLIPLKTYDYYKFNANAINDVGIVENTYDEVTTIDANIQPVPRSVYEQYGLSFQKTYYTIYTSDILQDLQRNATGDRVIYNNMTLQIESNQAEWDTSYVFSSYLAVRID